MEATLLVLAGGRVRYNPRAIAYDEKPLSESASRTQRTRWLHGHYWSLRRYGWALVRAGLRGAGPQVKLSTA